MGNETYKAETTETTDTVENMKDVPTIKARNLIKYREILDYVQKQEPIEDPAQSNADYEKELNVGYWYTKQTEPVLKWSEWFEMNNTNNLPKNYYNETPLSKDTFIVTKNSPIDKQTIEYEEPKQPGIEITQLKPQEITIDNWELSLPNPF